jgi:hypothetical protein
LKAFGNWDKAATPSAECATAEQPTQAQVQASSTPSHIFDDAEVVEAEVAALPTMQTNFEVK